MLDRIFRNLEKGDPEQESLVSDAIRKLELVCEKLEVLKHEIATTTAAQAQLAAATGHIEVLRSLRIPQNRKGEVHALIKRATSLASSVRRNLRDLGVL